MTTSEERRQRRQENKRAQQLRQLTNTMQANTKALAKVAQGKQDLSSAQREANYWESEARRWKAKWEERGRILDKINPGWRRHFRESDE